MSRTTTLLGYVVIGVAIVGYQLAGLVWRRTPTLAEAVLLVTRREWARWLLLAFWLWVGWHLFVRADWR